MTPFSQALRLWLRRASRAERGLAGLAVVLACSLVAWAALPVNATNQPVAATNGLPSPGGASQTGAPNSTPGASDSAASDSAGSDSAQPGGGPTNTGGVTPTTAGARPAATAGIACATGTGQGVTKTEVHLAFTIFALAGAAGNNTLGIPSADEQRSYFDEVAKSVNDDGGICGRKVVNHYYEVNGLDSSAPHQACLEMTADAPLIAFDTATIGSPEAACFARNHTPFFSTGTTSEDSRKYYPYVYSSYSYDLNYRNAILAWAQQGDFNDGKAIGKIGVVYQSCFPIYQTVMFRALREAGIPDDRVTKFDFDCNGVPPPADNQQAVLQFKNEGVTHVLVGYMPGDFGPFTNTAEQQGFRPQYRIADGATFAIANGNSPLSPNWDNIDGSTAITQGRFGEPTTPGFRPTSATQRCDALFAAAGRPTTYQQPLGWGGIACFYVWAAKAALEHAPALSAAGLAQGFATVETIPDPYPFGPSNFRPGELWAGRYWREVTASASCRCFTVAEPEFHDSFR